MTTPIRIYVPGDTAAVAVGANELVEAIQQRAAAQQQDVEIVRNGSRGMLWLEPLVEVESPEGRVAYGPVSIDDLDSLFAANWLAAQAHPLCHGLTEEIPYLKNQERLTFARVGIIDPLDLDAYQAHGGFVGLKNALQMAPADIVKAVTDSGLRGRGGAAFPTGIKWNTVLQAQADQKFIVCNADEGDSGTFSDRMLMEGDPYTLIEGMTIAGLAVGATEGYIYVRSEYPLAIHVLDAAIERAEAAGWLGDNINGSGQRFHLQVRKAAGAYICGEETSLLESLEGKRGMVRFKPPLPALEGFMGKPTVVNNVISLGSVPIILAKGGDYYRDYGMGRSRGTLAFQITGNVKQGGLVEK
ncbi:MAG TPA: formate dehydrogenase, partial [Paenalcaligenes sp.]|nr:formate dehydrogenase [Paenalcaligenes sp.]